MNTNYKELAAWYKFASTGKVGDYLGEVVVVIGSSVSVLESVIREV